MAVPVGGHMVYATRKLWLRDDLLFLGFYIERLHLKELAWLYELAGRPPGPVYFMYVTRRDFYTGVVRILEEKYKPVHAIAVDGAPVLKIFRLEAFEKLAE